MKLTAEQVRKAIFSGSVYASYDGAQYYASGIGMQAIADELNAMLDSGECEVIKSDNGLKCSHCGKELPYDPYADYEGNFCATCGARLRYGGGGVMRNE